MYIKAGLFVKENMRELKEKIPQKTNNNTTAVFCRNTLKNLIQIFEGKVFILYDLKFEN
jgi:hypothetical protein